MAPSYSPVPLIAFTVLMSVFLGLGAGFTQQDDEFRYHRDLLLGIRKFMVEKKDFILSELKHTEDLPSDEIVSKKQCSCSGYSCTCCMHLKIRQIDLDADVCLKGSYLPNEIGIQVQLTVNGKIVITKKVSAKNPPAICTGIPGIKKLASLCIRFYDLSVSVSKQQLSGCVEFQAKLAKVLKKKIKVGCFKVPPTTDVMSSENFLPDNIKGFQIEGMALPLNDVQQVDFLVPEVDVKSPSKKCICSKDSCKCCGYLKPVEALGVNQGEVCLNVTLLPGGYAFETDLSIDGGKILKEYMPTKNPRPICLTYSMEASLCVAFENLQVSTKELDGCIKAAVILRGKPILEADLGCFKVHATSLDLSSENSIPEINDDYQLEQVALPMTLKQSYKLSFELTEEIMGGPSCSCKGYSCQCCVDLKVPKVHLKARVCLIASLLPKELGIQVELTANGKTLFKQKVSASNPPPICGTFEDTISLCLVLSNLQFAQNKFEGCAAVEVKVLIATVAKVNIGCFKIPPKASYTKLDLLKQLAPVLVQTVMKEHAGEEKAMIPLVDVQDSLDKNRCQGGNNSYTCCVKFHAFSAKKSVCIKIVFLPGTEGIDIQLIVDGKVFFNQHVNVQDPPQICAPIPYAKNLSVCLKFKNLALHKDGVSGCIEIKARYKNVTVQTFDLGCFNIPPKVQSHELLAVLADDKKYFY